MEWLAAVVLALFALARRTSARHTARTPADNLTMWYRAWAHDSSHHPATAAELRQMLEAYRRGRRPASWSRRPDTLSAFSELEDTQPATASRHRAGDVAVG